MSKHLVGKYEPSLVYTSTIKAIATVRRHGIEKYGDSEDWRSTDVSEFVDAFFRHADAAFRDGEVIDADSNLPHAWLAMANLSYIIESQYGTAPHPVRKLRNGKTISQLRTPKTFRQIVADWVGAVTKIFG